MTFRKILFTLLIVIVSCLLIETVSYFILSSRNEHVGFFWNQPRSSVVEEVKGMGYDQIDPLCGWGMSEAKLKELGYEVERNCVVLKSQGSEPATPLKIFVTGGSTTDVSLNPHNWPVALQQLLSQKKVNAIIYVAALGGYSTAQELFTLFRDGLSLNPDVHISYSGVNEGYKDFGYVSDYEQTFYKETLKQSTTTSLLPATIYLIRKQLKLNYSELSLKQNEPMRPLNIWKQNMGVMEGIA